ncbi:hypothetical protein [Rhodococcus tukisamuensis]|uniref:DUF445 domain-containing protein n=1 Tax=Rhodococcus tukisamuensis TaxID=168276 RepID=A0A1G7DPN6_9NOCA|nr:hypothetical protein [Rhodococcus tukisamuensis]SDE52785.1 hypothetical protein SAMN05444580_12011 [Rhodococcus tukisamuensis]
MPDHLLEQLITIPLFTGIIGYITNWTGVLMLFAPVRFHGFRVPGLKLLFPLLPRRVQVIPAITSDGRFGWQGIVPSRAEKMASIAVDKSLAKVGSIADFYRVLDPDTIAEHLVTISRAEVRGVVTRIMTSENPQLWHNLPSPVKEAVFRKVEADLPDSVRTITARIEEDIDYFIDAKLMVIRYLSNNPRLLNDIFRTMGNKELRFMQNFGFYFGFPMGFVLVAVLYFLPFWWVLPIGGVIIGYIVNYLGIMMIFEPIQPNRWVPWRQGLFLKRRTEIIGGYAKTLADHVITLENIGTELLEGPRSDRTRMMLDQVLGESVDQAVGWARSVVRMTVGTRTYERIPSRAATEVLDFVPLVYADPDFAAAQSEKIRVFVTAQMNKLSPDDFSELLRSAVKQDEWLLFVHGAVLGSLAGFLHLAIFGV